MFTVQMCPENKTAFLLRILMSKLENGWWKGVCLLVASWNCVWMQTDWNSSQGSSSHTGMGRIAWSLLTEVPFRMLTPGRAAIAQRKWVGITGLCFVLPAPFKTLFLSFRCVCVWLMERMSSFYSPAPSLPSSEAAVTVFFFQGHSCSWAAMAAPCCC